MYGECLTLRSLDVIAPYTATIKAHLVECNSDTFLIKKTQTSIKVTIYKYINWKIIFKQLSHV